MWKLSFYSFLIFLLSVSKVDSKILSDLGSSSPEEALLERLADKGLLSLEGKQLHIRATITVRSNVVTWESSTDLCSFYRGLFDTGSPLGFEVTENKGSEACSSSCCCCCCADIGSQWMNSGGDDSSTVPDALSPEKSEQSLGDQGGHQLSSSVPPKNGCIKPTQHSSGGRVFCEDSSKEAAATKPSEPKCLVGTASIGASKVKPLQGGCPPDQENKQQQQQQAVPVLGSQPLQQKLSTPALLGSNSAKVTQPTLKDSAKAGEAKPSYGVSAPGNKVHHQQEDESSKPSKSKGSSSTGGALPPLKVPSSLSSSFPLKTIPLINRGGSNCTGNTSGPSSEGSKTGKDLSAKDKAKAKPKKSLFSAEAKPFTPSASCVLFDSQVVGISSRETGLANTVATNAPSLPWSVCGTCSTLFGQPPPLTLPPPQPPFPEYILYAAGK